MSHGPMMTGNRLKVRLPRTTSSVRLMVKNALQLHRIDKRLPVSPGANRTVSFHGGAHLRLVIVRLHRSLVIQTP